jgi:hypothetical protein
VLTHRPVQVQMAILREQAAVAAGDTARAQAALATAREIHAAAAAAAASRNAELAARLADAQVLSAVRAMQMLPRPPGLTRVQASRAQGASDHTLNAKRASELGVAFSVLRGRRVLG